VLDGGLCAKRRCV